jgi:hypothetical protein
LERLTLVTLRLRLAWVRVPLGLLVLWVLPLSTYASPGSPSLELSEECVPRATTPLPTCTPPVTAEERLNLSLDRAAASIERQQWSDAVEKLKRLETPSDYGARVRRQALLGVALSELNDPRADRELEQALAAWAAPEALAWIRSLPSGEASTRRVRRTYEAAASAAFQRAEILRRQTLRPLPAFARADEAAPFTPRLDAALTVAELRQRRAWRARYREDVLRYIEEVFAPWSRRQQGSVILLQREYEKVHVVAPGATPEWRVAVAASVGTLWGDYLAARLDFEAATRSAWQSFMSQDGYYGTFDDPTATERQLARFAFETCVTLSRRHRLLTRHTLTCEAWLAENYKVEHRRLDELMPTPQQESISAALQFAPVRWH